MRMAMTARCMSPAKRSRPETADVNAGASADCALVALGRQLSQVVLGDDELTDQIDEGVDAAGIDPKRPRRAVGLFRVRGLRGPLGGAFVLGKVDDDGLVSCAAE